MLQPQGLKSWPHSSPSLFPPVAVAVWPLAVHETTLLLSNQHCLWDLRVSCVSLGGRCSTTWPAAAQSWLGTLPAGTPGKAVPWSSLTPAPSLSSKPHSLLSAFESLQLVPSLPKACVMSTGSSPVLSSPWWLRPLRHTLFVRMELSILESYLLSKHSSPTLRQK